MIEAYIQSYDSVLYMCNCTYEETIKCLEIS